MKCYQIISSKYELQDSDIVPGLRVDFDDKSPLVLLKSGYPTDDLSLAARLDSELAKMLPVTNQVISNTSRVMACDIEPRGELWLVPETEQTSNEALVLFAASFGVWEKKHKPEIKFSCAGKGAAIILKGTSSVKPSDKDEGDSIAVTAALVKLTPGSQLCMNTNLLVTFPAAPLMGRQGCLYKNEWRITMSSGGTLSATREFLSNKMV